jgi:hypothetical protein
MDGPSSVWQGSACVGRYINFYLGGGGGGDDIPMMWDSPLYLHESPPSLVSLVTSRRIRVAAEGLWNILCESEKQRKKILYHFQVVWVPILMTVGLLNGRGVILEVAGGLGRVSSQYKNQNKTHFFRSLWQLCSTAVASLSLPGTVRVVRWSVERHKSEFFIDGGGTHLVHVCLCSGGSWLKKRSVASINLSIMED